MRPFGVPEWIYVSCAACLITLTGLLPLGAAVRAVRNGTDVYLFLAGMMLIAEIARREGVFDWFASVASRACGGSRARLFSFVYLVGIVVTAFLSNDATAVVLTPAVAASVRAADAEPLPFLFACAFVANAASFILPISNPANLVVFANAIPPLGLWLATFALPSLCAVVVTYAVLRVRFRRDLAGGVATGSAPAALGRTGRVTLAGLAFTALGLIVASSFGENLGAITALAAVVILVIVASTDRRTALPAIESVSWSVLPLVAGLFVLVEAVQRTGLLHATTDALRAASAWPWPVALAVTGLVTGTGSNLINNLPAGLIAGTTLANGHVDNALRSATAIGIDLGPNLSVTGSLATILWLLALRRENIDVSAWRFLRVGAIAMPLAMLAAVEALGLSTSLHAIRIK